jgi:hypothetical protein
VLRPRYCAVYQIRRRSATILVSTRVISRRRIAKTLRAEGVETDRRHRRTSAVGLRRLGMMVRAKSSQNPCHALAAVTWRHNPLQHIPLTLSAFGLINVRIGNESDKTEVDRSGKFRVNGYFAVQDNTELLILWLT